MKPCGGVQVFNLTLGGSGQLHASAALAPVAYQFTMRLCGQYSPSRLYRNQKNFPYWESNQNSSDVHPGA